MAEPVPTPRPRLRAIRHEFATPDAQLTLRMYAPAAGVVIVSADGEIDLANRYALAAALAPGTADPTVRLLVCDLSGTTFLACSGLSVLLEAMSSVEARGAALRVVTADATVLRVLDATGLRTALDVRPELVDAMSHAMSHAMSDAMAGTRPDGRSDVMADAMADAQAGLGDRVAAASTGGPGGFGGASGVDSGPDSRTDSGPDSGGAAADTGGHGAGQRAGDLAELAAALDRAVDQTSALAATWGRLAARVAALDADRLVDARGAHWRPRETLAEMAEDLRVLQNHLATGALLAAPTVEDLANLRSGDPQT